MVAASGDNGARQLEEEASGFLASRSQQKLAYLSLAAVWGITALAAVAVTNQWLDFSLGAVNAGLITLQRTVGAMAIPVAGAAYSLYQAADARRLDKDTYKRLNLGLVIVGAGYLYANYVYPGVLASNYERLALVIGVLTAVVPAIVYYHTSGHGFSLGRIANGFGDSVSRLLSAKNNKAGAYAITSAGFAAFAVIFTFGGATLQSRFASITAEASSELLRKNLGTLYAFAAIVAYNLKDAAERNRLSGTTFKRLNISLAGASAALVAAAWHVHQNVLSNWTAYGYAQLAAAVLAFLTTFTGFAAGAEEEERSVVGDIAHDVEGVLDRGADRVQNLLNRGERKADRATDKARGHADDLEDDARDTADKAKRKGENWADKAEETGKDVYSDIKKGMKDVKRDLDD